MLKMCEVALESVPQLATQWAAVFAAEVQLPPEDGLSMSALQCVSISTSTITIVFALMRYISQNRRKQWIHPGFPPAASLLPLGCLTLAAILSGTISFGLLLITTGPYLRVAGGVLSLSIFLNLGSMFFTIFAILMPCQSACCNGRCCNDQCCNVIYTLVHLCLSSILLTVIIYTLATEYADLLKGIQEWNINYLFVFIMIFHIIHVLLGILVFSGLYAKFFSPIISAFVLCVRKVVKCCCWREDWQIVINEMLDSILKIKSENQIEGDDDEEEEEEEQDLDEEEQEQDLGEEERRLEFLMQPLET